MNFRRSSNEPKSTRLNPSTRFPLPPIRANPPAPADSYIVPRLAGPEGALTLRSARYRRFALIGAAGTGKTAALDYLARTNPNARLVSLRDFHPQALPRDFQNAAWILLDDYTGEYSAYAAGLSAAFPGASLVLAARTLEGLPENFTALGLAPLNDREVYAFASAWFPSNAHGHGGLKMRNRAAQAFADAVKADANARTLATNPLNLFLLVQLYDGLERYTETNETESKTLIRFPTNRAELFDQYLRAVVAPETDPGFAGRALEGIALSTKRGQLAQDDHLLRGYGLLARSASGRIEFVHELIQDFLVARALRLNPDFTPLKEQLDNPSWQNVILFYAGLGEARELVSALRERDIYLAAGALAQWRAAPDDLRKSIAADLIPRAWEGNDPRALDALAQLRSNEAVEAFAAKLKDKDAQVRARAADALGALDNDRALEPLLPQLRDIDANVRVRVVSALGMSKSERVLEPLLVALRGDARMIKTDEASRIAAAHALGRIGSERAVPALIVDLQIGAEPVRAAAAEALMQIRSDLSVRPLQDLMAKYPKPEVREAAQQILSVVTKQ